MVSRYDVIDRLKNPMDILNYETQGIKNLKFKLKVSFKM